MERKTKKKKFSPKTKTTPHKGKMSHGIKGLSTP